MPKDNNNVWSDCSGHSVKTSELNGIMTIQYGSNCMSQRKVYEWVERFKG